MKRILMFFIIAAVMLALLSSCATIVNGTEQDIRITSTPSEADITIKNAGGIAVFSGKTPTEIKLSRSSSYIVTVNLEGFKESQVMIYKSFNPIFIGNLICGGVLGMIIDAASGAMWKLEPEAINVRLMTASIKGKPDETYAVVQYMDEHGELHTAASLLIRE